MKFFAVTAVFLSVFPGISPFDLVRNDCRGKLMSSDSVMSFQQLYHRVLNEKNSRAQRMLQSFSQECLDNAEVFYGESESSEDLNDAWTKVSTSPECSEVACYKQQVDTASSERTVFLTQDYSSVDLEDLLDRTGYADVCDAWNGTLVQSIDFSGFVCDCTTCSEVKFILNGIDFFECIPQGCPDPGMLDEEGLLEFIEISSPSLENCTMGGPMPPEDNCIQMCPDGVGMKAESPILVFPGDKVLTGYEGTPIENETITCGWVVENQANLPMFGLPTSFYCPFEPQCCGNACNACGDNKIITKPEGILTFPDGSVATCDTVGKAGLAGQIPAENCAALQSFTGVACGCMELGSDGNETTDPNTTTPPVSTSDPTSAPTPEDTTSESESSVPALFRMAIMMSASIVMIEMVVVL